MIAAGVLLVAFLAAAATHTEEIPRRAPYTAILWDGDEPIVRLGSEWFTLEAIDGIEADAIGRYCRETYDEIWQKRFEEDLVEVLIGMGHTPADTVQLVVRNRSTGETQTREEVAMTYANRQAIRHAAQARKWTQRAEIPKLSPYDAIRWEDGQPVVRVGGEWLTLEAIDGVTSDAIARYCRETYDTRWQKRFEEDLVEVLRGMGHPVGETVDLTVRDPGAAESRLLEGVAMTRANRQAIWLAAWARQQPAAAGTVEATEPTAE